MTDIARIVGLALFSLLMFQAWASRDRLRAYGRLAVGCAAIWAGFSALVTALYRVDYLTPTEALNLRSFPSFLIDAVLLLWAVNFRRWTRV